MVKKIVGGALGTVILGTLLWGTSFFGYVRTAKDEIQKAAKDAVPMPVQVANAERMVKDLKDEIEKWQLTVAEQQVMVKNMGEKIAQREAALGGQKKQILALNAELARGEKEYVFEGTTYSQQQVQEDLEVKFKNYRNVEDILIRDKDQFKARKETLSTTEAKFQEMVTMKKGLENEIGFLRARMEQQKADEAVGSLDIDDSKMAEARKTIEEIRTKMDVREKVREAQGRLKTSEIKVPEKKELKNVSKDIENYFGDEARTKTDL